MQKLNVDDLPDDILELIPDKPTLLVKWDIWALYAAHAVVLGSFGLWLPIGAYLIALEAAHRAQHKFHFGYHLAHHEHSDIRFNVFLPLWDFVLRTHGKVPTN